MILTGNEDLRVQKTIESVKSAFHELILEKDYEKITVKELCERARINKKTFIPITIPSAIFSWKCRNRSPASIASGSKTIPLRIDKLVREFFVFSEEQGEFYEKITCGGSYLRIREQHDRTCQRRTDHLPGAVRTG